MLHRSKVLFNKETLYLIIEIHVSPDNVSILGCIMLH